jgi:hypothetical protein
MENKRENQFQEQDAPLKNTDNAFVKVSKDGSPHMPTEQEEHKEENMKPERTTDMDKR